MTILAQVVDQWGNYVPYVTEPARHAAKAVHRATQDTNQPISITPIKGKHHMLSWLNLSVVGAVIVGLAAYEVGKNGLSATYTWVRGLFPSTTATTTVTPVAQPTVTPTQSA